MHLQRIAVTFDYPIYFTTDVFAPGNSDLVDAISRREPERCHRIGVIIDQGVADAWPSLLEDIDQYVRHHCARLELACAPLVLPGGESVKNDPAPLRTVLAALNAIGLDRQSAVVCVGGGALLDMVGYAAATAHRGIRMVRVPTTVLSQDDSGVGVKNGINAFGKKNFLGTFAPPFAVLNDSRFLESLSRRDLAAGMAEAVKVALIRDAAFFWWLVEHAGDLAAGHPAALELLVRRSAELHLEHIAGSGDPFEMGSARPLDFGHWAAHKLESLTAHQLLHGEAVAIGIAIDSWYSAERGLLDPPALEALLALMERLGLPLWNDALDARAEDGRRLVLDGLAEFREHLGGELTVTLLQEIGRGIEVHAMAEPLLERAVEGLRRRAMMRYCARTVPAVA